MSHTITGGLTGRPSGWIAGILTIVAACSSASLGQLTIEGAYSYAMPSSGEAAVYFTVHNPTAAPDTLVHVNTPEAAGVMYHRNVTEGGLVRMEHLETLVVPAGDSLVLAPGGLHLMLTSIKPRSPGDTIHMGLSFAKAGMRTISAVVREPGR